MYTVLGEDLMEVRQATLALETERGQLPSSMLVKWAVPASRTTHTERVNNEGGRRRPTPERVQLVPSYLKGLLQPQRCMWAVKGSAGGAWQSFRTSRSRSSGRPAGCASQLPAPCRKRRVLEM